MLKLISPVSDVFRKDFEIDTTNLSSDPTNANTAKLTVEGGIWVKISSQKAAHVFGSHSGATAGTAAVNVSTGTGTDGVQLLQVWNDKGDYGVQALGKLTTLFLGQYEAVTDKYHSTPAEGDLLTVDQKGNLMVAASAGDLVVAQCTKFDSTAGHLTYVRFASPYPLQ